MRINNRLEKSEIELWDCSGDLKYKKNYRILLRDLWINFFPNFRYENCWNAFTYESNGVVFVYNSNETSHSRELNQW